ncbi:ATP-binding protein [Alicyclobacillus dauci]|uniref:histidine kinase n=1 Tax=Alicyclobacillus dauci TaxID=1475485 RepID=A0ABY6Z5W5_9BACL|nr:ATP-binding protein [Alicyclobacillus dauci]WAH38277.1 ATP-binding protein [Alicyclobacillus dauci]
MLDGQALDILQRIVQSRRVKNATNKALKLLVDTIDVNTFFIAVSDGVKNQVIQAYNRNSILVRENANLPLTNSHYNLDCRKDLSSLHINEPREHPGTAVVPFAISLAEGNAVVAPILPEGHDVFGTLCVLDKNPLSLSDAHLELLSFVADMIGNAIDIEVAHYKNTHIHSILQALFKNNPNAVLLFNGEGLVDDVNPACLELFGPFNSNNPLYEYLANIKSRHVETNGPALELKLPDKHGNLLDCLVSILTLSNLELKEGFCVIVQDISAVKRLNDVYSTTERLSTLGQLAAGIAHDIRNPVTIAKGFAQLLLESNLSSQQTSYVELIHSSVQQVENIVTEFLEIGKPHATNMQLCNIAKLLDAVVNMLNAEAALMNVSMFVSKLSNEMIVLGSEHQLKQVLLNVLKNAIEASPKDSYIEIGLSYESEGRISISIKDNGNGIPEHILGRIGEPFFTTKEKGTGLGLLVCRKIVEAHNGVLKLSNNKLGGATVNVVLPEYHRKPGEFKI